MVNIPVWKIMPSCGVIIVKVSQRNYQNGFDVLFRLCGRWTLWRLFSDVFLSSTQSIFWKLWLKKRTYDCKLLGLVFSGKKVDICIDEDMKGSSACKLCRVSPSCLLWCVLSDHIPLTAVYPFTLQEIVLNLWRKANSHKLILIRLWLT